jgi:hypothetical protein
MLQSQVIEFRGVFIGAAIPASGGFRFRAVHPQVDDLDGQVYGSLAELRQATGGLFSTGRHGAPSPDQTNEVTVQPGEFRAGPVHRAPSAVPWSPR